MLQRLNITCTFRPKVVFGKARHHFAPAYKSSHEALPNQFPSTRGAFVLIDIALAPHAAQPSRRTGSGCFRLFDRVPKIRRHSIINFLPPLFFALFGVMWFSTSSRYDSVSRSRSLDAVCGQVSSCFFRGSAPFRFDVGITLPPLSSIFELLTPFKTSS